ncbi:MAG: insulinase family protein [Burkholderiales bacterium]|nr:insulinase family protein [Burkholderiales bacterium]
MGSDRFAPAAAGSAHAAAGAGAPARRAAWRALLACAAFALAPALPARAQLPIQHWQTSGGARVYFVENHGLPMLDLSVQFPAGSSRDRARSSGVAGMTNRLLQLGAEGMAEDEIARRLADVGAQLGARFDTDHAGLGLRTLVSERELVQALDVFARVLARPAFPADILEREKVRLIGALREADTRPDTIATVNFYRMLYRDHPYALRLTGDAGTVQGITREQLVAFHREYYAGARAVVAMIGDLSREAAERIAEQVTRDLPAGKPEDAQPPPVPPLPEAASRAIAHPASQAHIMIGALGMSRDDPDYFALYVGNYVLGGGGFVSRINEEIRQKRGLAYSAYSYFLPLSRPGPFVIGMQTQRAQARQALAVTREVLRDFVARGPTEAELTAARENIVGGFPLRIDSNARIHEYLAMIGAYRLPLTYLDDFVKNVERVTAGQVKDAFSRRIDPERMVTVVVAGEDGK